ncbi:hypothetical protein EDB86DRAFT_222269 [Lactarius hatsudake]|nr:hypothetical protein EDB86DRAFT_222269 [Lactarius hatsudake]
MPVCKRNLNPEYEPKDRRSTSQFTCRLSTSFARSSLSGKGDVGKDYLGEYSLPVDQWTKGTTFAFDGPNNEPFSVGLPHTSLQPFMKPCVSNDQLKVSIVAVEIYHAKDLSEWRNSESFDIQRHIAPHRSQ